MKALIHKILGLDKLPKPFRELSIKYLLILLTFCSFNLSKAWLSLWILQYLTFSEYGTIYAAGILVMLVLDFPMGLVTDRIGQKEAFIIAEITYFIYYLFIGFSSIFWMFLLLEILSGVGNAFMTGSAESWFMDTWQEHQKEYGESAPEIGGIYSNLATFPVFVTVIVMFLAGVVMGNTLSINKTTAQAIFLIQSIIPLLALVMAFKWIKNTNQKKEKKKLGIISSVKGYFDERTIKFSLIMVFFGLVWSLNTVYMNMIFGPLLNYQLAVTLFILSTIRTGGNFLGLTTRFSRRFMNRFANKTRIYLHSQLLTFPLYFLLLAVIINTSIENWIIVVLFVIVHLIRLIITGLSASEFYMIKYKYTDPQKRASQQSLAGTINSAILIGSYWLMGQVLDYYNYTVGLLVLTIITSIGMIGLYLKVK